MAGRWGRADAAEAAEAVDGLNGFGPLGGAWRWRWAWFVSVEMVRLFLEFRSIILCIFSWCSSVAWEEMMDTQDVVALGARAQ